MHKFLPPTNSPEWRDRIANQRALMRTSCVAALVCVASLLLGHTTAANATEAHAATTATTNPAPRYMSLGAAKANGREGPSRDHRILWQYQRRGLPVKVIEQWEGWRKVEDPFGDQAWLLGSMLERRRTVYVMGEAGEDAAMRQKPSNTSRVKAQLARGVVADLIECSRGWCEVSVDGKKGWVARRTLWGAETPPEN